MHIIHFGFHMRTSPQTKITIGFNTLLSGARNTVTRQHNFPSPIHFMREASNILSCSFIAFIPTRESFICYSYEPSSITFTFFRIFFSFSVLFFFFSFLFIFFYFCFCFFDYLHAIVARDLCRNRLEICNFNGIKLDYSFLHHLERKFYTFSRFGRWLNDYQLNIYNIVNN